MTESKGKTNEETSKKRLFQKGGKPGPGRGHKAKLDSQVKPLTMADIESALQQDLQSKDPKVRHPATRLLLALKKQVGQLEASDSVVDRWVLELILFLDAMQENIHKGTGQNVTGMDVIRRMSKVCLTCERIGAADATLPEVEE